MPYGSTKIRAADDYCPRALRHAKQGTQSSAKGAVPLRREPQKLSAP